MLAKEILNLLTVPYTKEASNLPGAARAAVVGGGLGGAAGLGYGYMTGKDPKEYAGYGLGLGALGGLFSRYSNNQAIRRALNADLEMDAIGQLHRQGNPSFTNLDAMMASPATPVSKEVDRALGLELGGLANQDLQDVWMAAQRDRIGAAGPRDYRRLIPFLTRGSG